MNDIIDNSWQDNFSAAYQMLSADFKQYLANNYYLPEQDRLFAAFQIPRQRVKFILVGESPYPRAQSANGLAFWDADVGNLWSPSGLSVAVNRATSLRNIIKMLLNAAGLINKPYTQNSIALLCKKNLVTTIDELFANMLASGFLLINASMTWSSNQTKSWHAKHWQPFINSLLLDVVANNPEVKIILLGKIAAHFSFLPRQNCLIAEHPYVLSFIENPDIINFFAPLNLLRAENVKPI